jgi:NAD(P)-dependent dehydrogenase (short-subunit alcohol dehydrogenase family)
VQDFFEDNVFAGRAALVTGGGTGLGLEIARLLARLGAKVAIASRNPEHHQDFLADAAREGWRARAEVLDVREPEAVRSVVEAVAADFGGLDVLVNNAAGNFIRPALSLPPKGWRAVIDIALSGVFFCSQAAAQVMRMQATGGAIVNIIAPYAWTGCPGVVHSVSAKAGVLAMSKSLAVEWAGYGIRVNCVAPGPFDTEGAAARLWPTPEMRADIEAGVPLGRFADTVEVARSVAYLASPQAAYITGATLTVDGGFSLGKGLGGELDPERVPRRRSQD